MAKTVEEVAQMLGLKQKRGRREWCGPNPWNEGAGEDGFILFGEGNAMDRNSRSYNTLEVAEMAGIDKEDYQPYVDYVAPLHEPSKARRNSSVTIGGQKSGKASEEVLAQPQSPPKEPYAPKTVEDRGISEETLGWFHVKFDAKRGSYVYPTYDQKGNLCRSRIKFLDPAKSFPSEKKPPKYIWMPNDNKSMPDAYNINGAVGLKEIWLVNGEPSVWICHQCGVSAIAPLGEGRKSGYDRLMKTLSEMKIETVKIALDADSAGQKGTREAMRAAKENNIQCVLKKMPAIKNGFDVDDLFARCDFDPDLFVKALEGLPAPTLREIEAMTEEMEKVKKPSKDESTSSKLVQMVLKEATLISGDDSSFYARMEIGGGDDMRPLTSGDFGLYLRYRWMKENDGKVLDSTSLSEAVESLKAMALFDENGGIRPKSQMFVRTGFDAENLYLDLCDDGFNVVVAAADGTWKLTQKPGVNFRRAQGMEALPIPISGGDINKLRPLLNAVDDAQWIKIVCWMIYSLRGPISPYPVLSLQGERGSSKSTTAQLIRNVIDPNYSPFVGNNSDERNLSIAAKNSYVVAFDNMSGMSRDMNDALCSLATLGAMRLRKLRTDDEEIMFKARRPIIVNGIDDSIGREDFRDRCVPVYLPPIEKEEREHEQMIYREFHRVLPEVLGGLLDIVAYGHANLENVEIPHGPRMMDFARFIVAAEDKCPWKKGTFLPLVVQASVENDVIAMESSLIAQVIQDVMKRRDSMSGSPAELLRIINMAAPANYKQARTWPNSPSHFTNALKRVAANLRQVGIYVDGLNPNERLESQTGITIRKESKSRRGF